MIWILTFIMCGTNAYKFGNMCYCNSGYHFEDPDSRWNYDCVRNGFDSWYIIAIVIFVVVSIASACYRQHRNRRFQQQLATSMSTVSRPQVVMTQSVPVVVASTAMKPAALPVAATAVPVVGAHIPVAGAGAPPVAVATVVAQMPYTYKQ